MNKATSQNRHAGKRMHMRYGVAMTESVKDLLLKAIKTGGSTFLGTTSNTRSVHDVQLKIASTMLYNKGLRTEGEVITVRAVYDKARGNICTVLDPDMDPTERLDIPQTYADVLEERERQELLTGGV